MSARAVERRDTRVCRHHDCGASTEVTVTPSGKVIASSVPTRWTLTRSGFNVRCPQHPSRGIDDSATGREARAHEWRPEPGTCESCGGPFPGAETGMCGACTFGEAGAWDEFA